MEPATVPTRKEAMPLLATRKDPRATRILARSLFKELSENGVSNDQILAVASELIGLVTEDLKDSQDLARTEA
jgi:hypothetical protein